MQPRDESASLGYLHDEPNAFYVVCIPPNARIWDFKLDKRAGVAGHIHTHVLPRWHGDTSSITTTGETRVLPEDLEITYERLSEACAAYETPRSSEQA